MSDNNHNRKAIRENYKASGGYDGRYRERLVKNKKESTKYPHHLEHEVDEYFEDLQEEVGNEQETIRDSIHRTED